MHMKLIFSIVLYGLHFFGALASPTKATIQPTGNHTFNPALEPRKGKYNNDLKALFDGTLGTLPALWLVSQGILAGFMSANSPRNNLRHDETALEDGGVMAAYVATMLLVPVNSYDDSAYFRYCQEVPDGGSSVGPAVVHQATGNAIFGGMSAPDGPERGLISDGYLGGAFGAVVGTSLTKTACDIYEKNYEQHSHKPELPKRRKLEELRYFSQERGFLVDASYPLLTSVLDRTLGPFTRMHVSQQIRDAFYLVEQNGLLKSFTDLSREILRQARALAEVATYRVSLSKADASLNALRALALESSDLLGFKTVRHEIKTYVPLADLATFASYLSVSLERCAEVPELSSAMEGLLPDLRKLRWLIKKRIEEERIRQTGEPPEYPIEDPPIFVEPVGSCEADGTCYSFLHLDRKQRLEM